MDRGDVAHELDRVRLDFRALLNGADAGQLCQLSDGTRWTNRQLLFHMLFGYLLVTRCARW